MPKLKKKTLKLKKKESPPWGRLMKLYRMPRAEVREMNAMAE